MGWGQYSANSQRLTKADMLADFGARFDIVSSKRAGHNRLDFTTSDGIRRFALMQTVVAEWSADRRTLVLADGGWHTPTTETAWFDALRVFGIEAPSRWGGPVALPGKGERSVAYVVGPNPDEGKPHEYLRQVGRPNRITGRAVEPVAQDYLIRASVQDGNFAVRYDGREIISEAGARVRCSPFKVLATLYRIDELARRTRGHVCFRGDALWQFRFEAFGFDIHPGQTSKYIMIGCHTFKTHEIRTELRRLALAYPDKAKAARAFVRKHPLDFDTSEKAAA